MRRTILGNRYVKRAITWAMVVMMSLSTAMSGFTTLTVYAQETNVIDGYDEYVDVDASKYHDDEAAKVAESSASVQDMNAQVDVAQQAATEAEAAVEDVKAEVAAAQEQQSVAQQAAADAENAAQDADTNAAEAKGVVEALPTDTAKEIEAYNAQVAEDQAAVDNIAAGSAVTVTTQGSNADGTTTEVTEEKTLEEYADIKAAEAQAAADEAKTALEEALAVDTDTVNAQVEEKVVQVNKAADKAAAAAEAAEAEKDKAQDQKDAAIWQYNLYAMSYGLPLYGEDAVSYTAEQAKTAVEAAGMQYQTEKRNELQAEIDEINATTLAEQEAAIKAAEEKAVQAETACDNAQAAAAEAEANAQAANELITEADKKADTAADAVANYHVTPAKEALDATKGDITAKNEEIAGIEETKKAAEAEAAQAGQQVYADELKRLEGVKDQKQQQLADAKKAEQEAEDAYNKKKWSISRWLAYEEAKYEAEQAQDAYDNASNAYNAYNTENAKQNTINNTINNSSDVKAANAALQTAETEKNNLLNQEVKQQATLDAETAARDAYLAQAQAAAGKEARVAFAEKIDGILAGYSDEINQIDYDEDLYDWSNDTFNTWDIVTKGMIRRDLDDQYSDDALNDLFNTLAISQWIVDTDDVEAVMDEIRTAYREEIEAAQEKLATAEATWAAMDTEAAKTEAAKELEKFEPVVQNIATAKTQVEAAEDKIETARETYDKAAADLTALQASVANSSFDDIQMKALQEKIEAAQAALHAAKDELGKAEKAKEAAENYRNWANALVTEHTTEAFAQALVDGEGNKVAATENLLKYDETNDAVASRPTTDFVEVTGTNGVKVPYAIYRDYVEAMYQAYDVNKNGKGTSTGSNMDVLYWTMENGTLTGDYFTSMDQLTDGTYFVGYTFKKESDGYHLDGTVFEYKAPTVSPSAEPSASPSVAPSAEPTATPAVTSAAPAAGGGDTPGVTPTDDTPAVVTIEDAPVAMAAAPVTEAEAAAPVAPDAAVLGANRTDAPASDAAVLGASRGNDQAVLGKRRRPETGDSVAINLWMAMLTMATGSAGLSGMKLARSKKEDKDA